jgi:uncharacterized iron-regulated membrane protein
MKKFRKIIFWIHLLMGVISGISIFVMCVTGALLAFESNILEFVERDMRYVSSTENQKIPVNEIIRQLSQAKPEAKISAISINNNPNSAITISLGRDGQYFVNPYTAEITGEGSKNWRGFFRVTEDLHRWLAISGDGRPIGKAINDICNFAFLLLAISGIYIWFPRRLAWSNFKQVIWFRKGLGGKARDFNWHNVIGFWSSTILIILTLTGVVMSYQWAGNFVYTLTGNEIPKQNAPNNPPDQNKANLIPENINQIWQKAEHYTTWKSISLRLPIINDTINFTIDEGIYANKFGRSTLTIDAKTGEITKWESYGEQNSGRQLRSWIRFTHTGESFGLIGQFIGFLACIGGAFLVWTGFSLSFRRFSNWRKNEKKQKEML